MTTYDCKKMQMTVRIPPNMVWIAVEAKKLGYSDAEFVREGIRLFAKYRLNCHTEKEEKKRSA